MKLRAVATVGAFAAGYAVGAATGSRHTRRLAQLAGRAGRSAPVAGTAVFVGDKVGAASRLALEWLKDVAGTALGWRSGDEAADALVIDLAEELAHAINEHGYRHEYRHGYAGDETEGPLSGREHVRSRRVLAQASSR
jgi:hypothetical protein